MRTIACLLLLAAVATAAPLLTEYVREGAGPADARVFLQVAVKQVGAQWLQDTLLAVSDPRSPRYGA